MTTHPGSWRLWRPAAVLALVLTTAGCAMWRGTGEVTSAPVPAARLPILVVPPLTPPPAVKSDEHFGELFYNAVAARSGGRAIAAARVPGLKPLLAWEALSQNGDLNAGEVRAIGVAANCASVVVPVLLELKPYAPQAVALDLLWVDVESEAVIRRVHLRFDLNDPAVGRDFNAFMNGPPLPLVDWGEKSPDHAYVATLSPSDFQRYVAERSLDRLLAAPR